MKKRRFVEAGIVGDRKRLGGKRTGKNRKAEVPDLYLATQRQREMSLQGRLKNINTDKERECNEDEDQNTDSDGNGAEFSFHGRCQQKTKDGATWEQSQRQEFIIIGYSDARNGERALGALFSAIARTATQNTPARSVPASPSKPPAWLPRGAA